MPLHPSIFREYDIRGVVPSTLSPEDALLIGRAFGARVGKPGRICVGYDGRLSSPALRDALTRGLVESGHRVLDTGLGPTPQLYFAVYALKADAGIMVTGSHNPPDQNGFKFMLGTKPFFGDDIRKLREAGQGAFTPQTGGSTEPTPVADQYIDALVSAYSNKKPLRIAWDAGNGAAGQVMAALCKRLPGTHILLNETIDGTFPAHHPDPTEPKNLVQLIDEVRRSHCDAGIAFDGDGDRIGVVDDEGEILWGDQLMMFYAAAVLQENPGATIIADVKASQLLFDEIARLGGTPLMWKTGHSHIKSKMAETGALLAGEMSGHIFFADKYFGFDDGLYAAVRLLALQAASGKPLSAWRKSLPRVVNTPELRFPCDDDRKFAVVEEVRGRLIDENQHSSSGAVVHINNVDGVRVQTTDGWWLLRASNTQAMLVARAEAKDATGLKRLKEALRKQLAISKVARPDYPVTKTAL